MVYLDTVGVQNPSSHLIDVRRFDARPTVEQRRSGEAATTMLVVDNWRNISGLSVAFRGRSVPVPAQQLSIIVV